MAEAARTVRHYVSDCLQERHPYDAQKAFAGRPQRDIGLVYNGLQPHSSDDWMESLSDPEVCGEQRVRAVRLLIAHSASQETKVVYLRKNVVSKAVAALLMEPSADFERHVFLLLRSLCTISQGCRVVMDEGGLSAAIRSIHNRDNLEERAAAREAAVFMIYQISFNAAGVRWLLEAEVPEGFEFTDMPPSSCEYTCRKEDVIEALVLILQKDFEGDRKTLMYAITCLCQLTAQTEGIFAAMKGGAVTAVSSLLHKCVSERPDKLDEDILAGLLVVVSNVSMEQTGVEFVDELQVPDDLFLLLAEYYECRRTSSYPFLRALTGALSVVYKLLSVKMRSLEELVNGHSRIMAIYILLHVMNDVVTVTKHACKEQHPDVIAISKNLVLSTRFAMEVKAVRSFTHSYLEEMDETTAFYFRRQLFYSTKWEEEFDAAV
uniref:Uncharacterized protein n=1 Tax=Trypanosoma congolense (strain IL3000) TaxID=1068625 RepID=G0UK68_TRYCI|nr:conserved hypothetical protein [Trypanosoma congolense IL3000]